MDIFDLSGKSAIVTGASKGLGEAMARALAKAGADVLITSRHRDEVDQVAANIADATSRNIVGMQSDVTRREEVEAMTQRGLDEFGKIDILVNNAGINIRKPLMELADEEWQSIIDINLTGPMLCSRAVGRHMIERRSGRVINIASMIGVVSIPGRTAYASSKGALLQLTRTLALEWAPSNVLVNAICPGPFATPLNRKILDDPATRDQFISKIPLGRFGDPEDLDGAVVFLASDASRFATGSALFVDGGWTAQ